MASSNRGGRYLRLENELHLYPSGVYASVKRARASHLVQGPELGDRLNRSSLLEFLLHGIRYSFPAEIGPSTRGIPTSYAAPPLRDSIADAGDLRPVGPYADGKVRGYSLVPLHKNVPQAALEDARLYELRVLSMRFEMGVHENGSCWPRAHVRRFDLCVRTNTGVFLSLPR